MGSSSAFGRNAGGLNMDMIQIRISGYNRETEKVQCSVCKTSIQPNAMATLITQNTQPDTYALYCLECEVKHLERLAVQLNSK